MLDGARFRRLALAQWMERRREFGLFMLVLVGLHAVLVTLNLASKDGFHSLNLAGQASIFELGLILTAPVFAARYFLPLSRRDAGPTLLLRPASNLEKFLLALLVVMVLYPIAYTLLFYVCDLPAALVAKSRAAEALAKFAPALRAKQEMLQPELFGVLRPRASHHWLDSLGLGLMLLLVVLWTMFGTLWFRSSPMIKTFVAGFAMFLLLILLTEWSGGSPDRLFAFLDPDAILAPWKAITLAAGWVVVPSLSLWACYLALCEREAA